jgi:hypothetical protein
MKFSIVSLWFTTFLLFGCPVRQIVIPPDVNHVVVEPDGAILDTPARVCLNLRVVGCSEGFGECDAVIRDVLASPEFARLNTACLEVATTRDAVRKCGQPCR